MVSLPLTCCGRVVSIISEDLLAFAWVREGIAREAEHPWARHPCLPQPSSHLPQP